MVGNLANYPPRGTLLSGYELKNVISVNYIRQNDIHRESETNIYLTRLHDNAPRGMGCALGITVLKSSSQLQKGEL